MLTQERLREVLTYNPCTGVFRWKITRLKAKAGKIAGCRRYDGYLLIKIDGISYRSSRLAWLYVHGRWPNEIDHINRNQTNDSIWNLNDTDRQGNVRNSRAFTASGKRLRYRRRTLPIETGLATFFQTVRS